MWTGPVHCVNCGAREPLHVPVPEPDERFGYRNACAMIFGGKKSQLPPQPPLAPSAFDLNPPLRHVRSQLNRETRKAAANCKAPILIPIKWSIYYLIWSTDNNAIITTRRRWQRRQWPGVSHPGQQIFDFRFAFFCGARRGRAFG